MPAAQFINDCHFYHNLEMEPTSDKMSSPCARPEFLRGINQQGMIFGPSNLFATLEKNTAMYCLTWYTASIYLIIIFLATRFGRNKTVIFSRTARRSHKITSYLYAMHACTVAHRVRKGSEEYN